MAADPYTSRIRSQQHKLSAASDARKSSMHAVSRKAGFYGRGKRLRGLSRGYSPAEIRSGLRTVSHGSGMEYHGAAGEGSSKPLSAFRCARGGAMRGMSQERGGGAVSGTLDAVYLLPPEGLSTNDKSEPRERALFNGLRNVPHL